MVEETELREYTQKDDGGNDSIDTLHGSEAITHRKTGKNNLMSFVRDNTSEIMSLDADVEVAEVKRELKPRHISMISLGGTIGTGLFVVTSQPLRVAGPVGSLIAYLCMATIIYSVTQSLGEMATFIPVTSSFTVFAQRFVSPAFGVASGYLYWFSWCMTFALELSVIGHLIQHWTTAVPLSAWIVIFWILLTLFNLFPVKYYGEIEFWIASIKVISILGYLIYAFLIVCGASPQGPIGFRYWRNPGPWGTGMIAKDITLARFLGWVNSLIRAAFTYQGTELVGITAGESKNPRKAVPKAINQVFFRIIFFYIFSLIFLGLLVPYDDVRLAGTSDADVNSSPFVISIQNAGTKVLPDIFNGIVIMTIVSAGNSNVYVGSRVLYGLSKMRVAPAIFRVTSKRGVPYVSVLSTAVLGCFAFLNVTAGAEKVFNWLLNSTAVAGFFTWLFISISHIRFMKALKYRGISRDDLPFKAHFMPWAAYCSSFVIVLIIFIQGFTAFAPKFSFVDFVALYISVFIFVVSWIACQLLFKTKWLVPIEEIDIDTDRREIDAMVWVESTAPRNFFQKLWDNV